MRTRLLIIAAVLAALAHLASVDAEPCSTDTDCGCVDCPGPTQ